MVATSCQPIWDRQRLIARQWVVRCVGTQQITLSAQDCLQRGLSAPPGMASWLLAAGCTYNGTFGGITWQTCSDQGLSAAHALIESYV